MDLFVLMGLILLISPGKGYSFQDYSSLTDEDNFFLEETDDSNFTSEVEGTPNNSKDEISLNLTSLPAFGPPFPGEEKKVTNDEEEEDGEGEKDDLEMNSSLYPNHRDSILMPNAAEDTSEKLLLDHLSKIHRSKYNNYENNFQNEETDLLLPPSRRDLSEWRARDDLVESENIPWNYDVYPRDKYVQTEYVDFVHPSDARGQNGSSSKQMKTTEDNSRLELPQYYQKNYYYNYYPFPNERRYFGIPKWAESDESSEEAEKKTKGSKGGKRIRKSSCKQYLQFLKYAFEKLDETPDYRYDYPESYEDNAQSKDKSTSKDQKIFTTHLLGPTLYIDNSGKVSQINSKGNSFQNVEGLPGFGRTIPEAPTDFVKPTTPPTLDYAEKHKLYNPTTLPDFYHHSPSPTWKTIPQNHVTNPVPTTPPFSQTYPPPRNFNGNEPFHTKYPEMKYPMPYVPKSDRQWSHEYDESQPQTTIRVDLEDYEINEMTTPIPVPTTVTYRKFPHEDFFKQLGNAFEKTTTTPAPYSWFRKYSPPSITKSANYPGHHAKPNNLIFRKEHGDLSVRKEDVDCNDKMLPCPDTFNVTYPLNGYCNRYVSCESGRAIRRTCPEGLHFNVITKSCDLPHNSFCTYACPEMDGYYGIPGDCGGYFYCKNSVAEYRMCPPRMHWDIEKGTCTFADMSSCPMKCSSSNEVKHYPGDCMAYIICLNGIPFYHKCPPNTKFDDKGLTCVPETKSTCEDDFRLLTKQLNPNHLCRDIQLSLDSKIWCDNFQSTDLAFRP